MKPGKWSINLFQREPFPRGFPAKPAALAARNLGCGRNSDGGPDRGVPVIEAIDLPPSGEGKDRSVVAIVNKNVAEAIMRGVPQHVFQR